MNAGRLIDRMALFPDVLRACVAGLSSEEVRFRAAPDDWSVLQVVCHLGDEECEDFRARLRALLRDPGEEWSPIDPPRWAIERGYAERDLAQELDRFEGERAGSVAWLRGLKGVDWASEKVHPKFGSMRAGDLLGAWCAHDQLHLRQIARRRFEMTERDAGVFGVGYAGEW